MASRLNGSTSIAIIISVLVLLSGFVLHNNRTGAATATKVQVVEEREQNHYEAICEDLCRMEQKLDRLLERGE